MENKESIRKKLNLTQKDMAMILKISRSEWALYELGLRKLSASAMIRLSQIERFFLSDVSESKQFSKVEAQEMKKNKFLQNALKENELMQMGCEQKMERVKNNYEVVTKQLHLIDFLSKQTDVKDVLHRGAMVILQEKADKALNKNGPLQLLKLELEQQQLKQNEILLKKMLKEDDESKA